ncbi:MAG: hypothetical protein WC749_14380 [Dehalococcoidia bacterium]
MSELIKKLERISHGNGQPLGFGSTAKSKIAPMMLVARLSKIDASLASSAISEGAEALLFDIENAGSRIDALSKIASSIEGVPWGVRLSETVDPEDIKKLADAGCDCVVFKAEVPARILGEEKTGKVLEIDASLSDGLARAIAPSSIDAIIVKSDCQPLITVNQFLNFQRLIAFAGKPALAFSPADVSDLEILWEIGVRGIVVDFGDNCPGVKLAAMKDAIQALPVLKRKPKRWISPILPTVQSVPDEEEFEEDVWSISTLCKL